MRDREIVKAQEVLRRYASGARDFRNANLRGANFKGQDLSGADFSGADIRSANFCYATLRGVNFTHVHAGLQHHWVAVQLLLIALLAFIVGLLQLIANLFTYGFSNTGGTAALIAYIAYLLLLVATFVAIAVQGFTIRACVTVLVANIGACLVAVAGEVAALGSISALDAGMFTVSIAGAVLGSVAAILALSSTVAISATGAAFCAVAISGVAAFSVSGEIAFIGAVATILLSFYVGWQVLKENEKFAVPRLLGLLVSTIGGTSFCGANLTGARFNRARLKSTNFADARLRATTFTHVCWYGAERLNRARLGSSILRDFRVRTLLTTPEKGYTQDLSDANLRGANLSGTTLENAILRRAILSNALLTHAVLKGATLTEAQAIKADFTGACLTGATLESWNIDSTTTFQNIDCQYVFLREHPDEKGSRERRPHDPDKVFQLGDFEKFFKEMLDDVQILIRNGIEPIAFRSAFEKLMANHPTITQDAIQSIEKKGPDVLMTLQVPENLDKAQLEQDWDEGYQAGLKAGKDAGRLESADKIEQLAFAMAQTPSTIYNQNTIKNVAGDDQSQTIDIQGDVNQSAVSLGDQNNVSNQAANPLNPPTDDDRSLS